MSATGCLFCDTDGGEVLWRDQELRVIAPMEPDYPGYLRVVWNAHVREMTDLSEAQCARLMAVVFATESVLRAVMSPDKINLACFGNVVPHIHWHVIPRYTDDAHFPNPTFGARLRDSKRVFATDLRQQLKAALNDILSQGAEGSEDR